MAERSDTPNSALSEWERVAEEITGNWIDVFNDGSFLRRVVQKGDDLGTFEVTNNVISSASSMTEAENIDSVSETNTPFASRNMTENSLNSNYANSQQASGGGNGVIIGTPKIGDRVKIKSWGVVECKEQNSSSTSKIDENEELEFVVGLSDVLQVYELAVQFMTINQVDEAKVKSRFAYGDLGRIPDVPENATITYTIKLLSIEPGPDIYNMNFDDRIAFCDARKDRGNYFFKRQEFDRAVAVYKKGIQAAEVKLDESILDDSERKKFNEVRIALYNNISAAYLKLENYDGTIAVSEKALKIAPKNLKSLFRKAKAHFAKNEFEEALSCYNKLVSSGHTSEEVDQEILRCKRAVKRENERKKKLYERMLGVKNDTWTNRFGWAAVVGVAALGAALALRFFNARQ